jgi:hypothetical protein
MPKLSVDKCSPYKLERIFGVEKYSLNNMLIRQADFPANISSNDNLISIWTDKVEIPFISATTKYLSEIKKGPFESGLGIQSLDKLSFLSYMKDSVEFTDDITGARMVRFTNASSCYPVYRIDLYIQSSDNKSQILYSDNNAPNVYGGCNSSIISEELILKPYNY